MLKYPVWILKKSLTQKQGRSTFQSSSRLYTSQEQISEGFWQKPSIRIWFQIEDCLHVVLNPGLLAGRGKSEMEWETVYNVSEK